MLQMIKDVVLQMIPNITQQQHQMQPPSFQDAFPLQQILPIPSFPSQNAFQTQPHTSSFPIDYQQSNPPQTIIQRPPSPTNIPSPSTNNTTTTNTINIIIHNSTTTHLL